MGVYALPVTPIQMGQISPRLAQHFSQQNRYNGRSENSAILVSVRDLAFPSQEAAFNALDVLVGNSPSNIDNFNIRQVDALKATIEKLLPN